MPYFPYNDTVFRSVNNQNVQTTYTKSRLCTSKIPPHGSIYIEIPWIFAAETPGLEVKKKIFRPNRALGGPKSCLTVSKWPKRPRISYGETAPQVRNQGYPLDCTLEGGPKGGPKGAQKT